MASSEEIQLRITAKNEASKVIAGIDKEIDALQKQKAEIRVSADTKDADKKLGAIDKEIDELNKRKAEIAVTADTQAATRNIQDVLDKVDRLGGEPGQILLSSNAAQITNEIGDLIIDIDRLDAADPEVTVKVDQIHALEGDLERLQAKAKEVGATPITLDTTPARKGIDDMGRSADSSKSVLANMVGNTTQDLGALGGVAGSAGVAIGQMGEYMADAAGSGDKLGQVLRGFGGVAVPLLAIGVATQAISGHFEKMAEDEKQATDQMHRFSKSIQEGANEAQVLRDELEATGELKFNVQIEGPDIRGGDLVGPLARAGLTLEDFIALTKVSNEEFRAWRDNAEAAGVSTADLGEIALASAGYFQQTASASANAANNNEVLGKTYMSERDAILAATLAQDSRVDAMVRAEEAATAERALQTGLELTKVKTDQAAAADEAYAVQIDAVNAKLEEMAAAEQAVADALLAQIDAAKAVADSNFAAVDSQEKLADATRDTNAATLEWIAAEKEHGVQSEEARAAHEKLDDAIRSERDGIVDAADAAQRLADDQAAANGTTRTAQQRVEDYNTSLIVNARSATPAARQAAYEYLIQLNQIPEDKATEIRAAVEAGDLETANRLLEETSATRTAAIEADAHTGQARTDLNSLTKPLTTSVTANVTVNGVTSIGGGKYRLPGGLVVGEHGIARVPEPGGIAGEAGAEFVDYPNGERRLVSGATYVPPGSKVTSAARTRSILHTHRVKLPRYANGTGGASTIMPANITINAGVIGNRFDVARAVSQAQRDLARIRGTRP